ncbi:TetR family transcriptional regulator [Paraburkholderia xenovorans]|nr:TetR family transcriptional regulator [Paraburkholderia xenovorans]
MTTPAISDTTSTPRAQRVSARRRQLVELTMQLLKEKGFDLLSVNELAERASMSVGGLYRYIKTKSDLLEMICDETNKGLNEQMMERTSTVRGVKEKLRVGFEVYWQGCWDAAEPILTAYREWQSLPEAAQHRYIEQEKRVAEYFSDLIRAGVASDEFRVVDARLLAAEMIFLAQMRAVKGWAFHGWDRTAVFAEHWELIESRLRK